MLALSIGALISHSVQMFWLCKFPKVPFFFQLKGKTKYEWREKPFPVGKKLAPLPCLSASSRPGHNHSVHLKLNTHSPHAQTAQVSLLACYYVPCYDLLSSRDKETQDSQRNFDHSSPE